MHNGLDLDPQVLIQVQQSKIADMAIKNAQLEAGVQQLMMENARLHEMMPNVEEVFDESSAE